MKVAIVTLFPEMFEALTQYGVSGRAVERGIAEIACFNPRKYAQDRHGTIDDKPYGGGPGMVMMAEPLLKSIQEAKGWVSESHVDESLKPKVVYLSPQGQRLNHNAVERLSECQHWVLIAGRYEGIDERVVAEAVDEEWSIGDYVLSGGELPAMVLLDAMLRMVPGVLGDAQSAQQDSFVEGLLDAPHYTRPDQIDRVRSEESKVPEVLLSGDHKRIAEWRRLQAIERTYVRRPDLFDAWRVQAKEAGELSKADQAAIENISSRGPVGSDDLKR